VDNAAKFVWPEDRHRILRSVAINVGVLGVGLGLVLWGATRHAWWGFAIALLGGVWSALWALSLVFLLRELLAVTWLESYWAKRPPPRGADDDVDQVAARRWPCPCCGHLTLDEEPPGTYDICPVCWWEDDDLQFENPDYRGGANEVSLNEARRNFEAFGSSDERGTDRVRPPNPDELPDSRPG
jgi:hypothetical protein